MYIFIALLHLANTTAVSYNSTHRNYLAQTKGCVGKDSANPLQNSLPNLSFASMPARNGAEHAVEDGSETARTKAWLIPGQENMKNMFCGSSSSSASPIVGSYHEPLPNWFNKHCHHGSCGFEREKQSSTESLYSSPKNGSYVSPSSTPEPYHPIIFEMDMFESCSSNS
ncbi:hypothetical protein VCUG_02560 [Vavraia culicis subsp. floridensis]|uniref:Uncharacterized protein n=1 Tax=Vavraia culicis (isolate floridensis) TaxID=948595 RepID=L2GRG0_VAVCU|nr:uncharacterized protein VCUG_02560 [Vavraia culicis subsp. floridensis]ELA45952.1 hypothetical protein VCUG_02560 [Vavraia culicis subsp. floridensis]